MTYETIDLESEARRLKAAFKADTECEFSEVIEFDAGVQTVVLRQPPISPDESYPVFPLVGDTEISVEYSSTDRFYGLNQLRPNMDGWDETEVFIDWSGKLIRARRSEGRAQSMAEALFCLELLTPEIEQALGVTISAHEKAELVLAYDARLKVITT